MNAWPGVQGLLTAAPLSPAPSAELPCSSLRPGHPAPPCLCGQLGEFGEGLLGSGWKKGRGNQRGNPQGQDPTRPSQAKLQLYQWGARKRTLETPPSPQFLPGPHSGDARLDGSTAVSIGVWWGEAERGPESSGTPSRALRSLGDGPRSPTPSWLSCASELYRRDMYEDPGCRGNVTSVFPLTGGAGPSTNSGGHNTEHGLSTCCMPTTILSTC